MSKISLQGRVALVTGAGRGLGREHALQLAQRGATVVVSDLGCELDGSGMDPTVAAAVAGEITAAGGEAISVCADVTNSGGADAAVGAAMAAYGRLDILVNNVGGSRMYKAASILDRGDDDFDFTLGANLRSALIMTRTVWPILVEQGYGRVVNTSSTSALGSPRVPDYGAVKSGIIGLTRSMAEAGEPHGIRVNAVMPAAYTRAIERNVTNPARREQMAKEFTTAMVSPIVVLLAAQECPFNGDTIHAAGGLFSRVTLVESAGVVLKEPTPEDLLERAAEISSLEGSRAHQTGAELRDWVEDRLGNR